MTEAEKRAAYLEWINRYCKQAWVDEYVDPLTQETVASTIPLGVELILQEIVKKNPAEWNVTSKSFEGLSVSYSGEGPLDAFKLHLRPYRKVRML